MAPARNSTSHRKKALLEALTRTLGVVEPACKAAGVNRVTHYRWLREDPKYAADVQLLNDVALDFAESNLFKQIGAGQVASTIFYLKTKGKHRGYIEKSEVELSGHVEGTGVLAVPTPITAEQWGVLAATQQAGLAGVKP